MNPKNELLWSLCVYKWYLLWALQPIYGQASGVPSPPRPPWYGLVWGGGGGGCGEGWGLLELQRRHGQVSQTRPA